MGRRPNHLYIEEAFGILHPILADYIYSVMKDEYGSYWWDYTRERCSREQQRNLPNREDGDDEYLKNKMDMATCLNILIWSPTTIFKNRFGDNYSKLSNRAHILLETRVDNCHIEVNDISQEDAERSLYAMVELCQFFDMDEADKINTIYKIVRANGLKGYIGVGPMPVGAIENDNEVEYTPGEAINLNDLIDTNIVKKTHETSPVTFGGESKILPVFEIDMSALYYNDQNDRIATWLDRYNAENGEGSLDPSDRENYNNIIENFIYESNPEALKRTQKNIQIEGQHVAGVTLGDGRIVDGNRRFTCLRRIQRETATPQSFKTVILDLDIERDKKQIKMLELAIQHGEEKKVDYDLIDYAVGTYKDIEIRGLLTVEEYAQSAKESVADVKKRIEIAKVIAEFLRYIGLPEQFHVAREYQLYSLFQEMMPILNKLDAENKQLLKTIAFNNVLLHAILDQRRFIRDVKALVSKDCYKDYFEEQKNINILIHEKFDNLDIQSKRDADKFADDNEIIREKLRKSLDDALQASRRRQLKSKPLDNVSKSVSMLADVDEHVFDKLNDEEKEVLQTEIGRLSNVVNEYRTLASGVDTRAELNKPALAISNPRLPIVLCRSAQEEITARNVSFSFSAVKESAQQDSSAMIKCYFVNSSYTKISNVGVFEISESGNYSFEFALEGVTKEDNKLFLIIQAADATDNEALRIIPFEVHIEE